VSRDVAEVSRGGFRARSTSRTRTGRVEIRDRSEQVVYRSPFYHPLARTLRLASPIASRPALLPAVYAVSVPHPLRDSWHVAEVPPV